MKIILRVLGVIAACVGIVLSGNMISTGKNIEIPDKYVYVSSSSSAYEYDWSRNTGAKYLGGDAYNYIVEASLKAGYYNATVTKKTIMETGGTVLLFVSIFFFFYSLYSLQNSLNDDKKNTAMTDYRGFVLQHLQRIEENSKPQSPETDQEPPEITEDTDL